jgi:protein gp37
MARSSIEWTEATWNPVTGCTSISEGCQNCYAESMALRLKAMGQEKYRKGFEVATHESALRTPLGWKAPRMIFVNSMSDLFHHKVPQEFVLRVFDVMRAASRHTFQILTKRPERAATLNGNIQWPDNVWMGVTVELNKYTERMDMLRDIDAAVRFVSFEPLLGPIAYPDLSGIDWAIVGGESGPRARPMEPDWALDIRDACLQQSVPFFFKQWGGKNKKKAGRILEGREWNQMPVSLEWPPENP